MSFPKNLAAIGHDFSDQEPGSLVEVNGEPYVYNYTHEGLSYVRPLEPGEVIRSSQSSSKSSIKAKPKRKYTKRKAASQPPDVIPIELNKSRHVYTTEEDQEILHQWLIKKPKMNCDTELWKELRDQVNKDCSTDLDYISVKRRLDKIIKDRKSENSQREKESGIEEERSEYDILVDDTINVWEEVNSNGVIENDEFTEDIREVAMQTCGGSKSKSTKNDILQVLNKREDRHKEKQEAKKELFDLKKVRMEFEIEKEKETLSNDRIKLQQRDKELDLEAKRLALEEKRLDLKKINDEGKAKEREMYFDLLNAILKK